MSSSIPPDSTIILGGGIIGLSTAYYLSLHQPTLANSNKIHIIDSAPSLLLSASGYAGGFLAKDWFSPESASLGALSFRLHKELADAHDGHRNWGYAEATSYSLSVDDVGVSGRTASKKSRGKDWLLQGTSRADVVEARIDVDNSQVGEVEMLNDDGTPAWITKQEGGTLEVISSEDGCAQVEPKELGEWLIKEVESRGVKIHLNVKTDGIVKDNVGKVSGLKVQTPSGETRMACKNIAVAAGAWSSKVFKTLFPSSRTRIGIGPLAGYSIVVRSPRYSKPILDPARYEKANDTGVCHAVFCAPGRNWSFAPEAISRMTKSGKPEVYVAGQNDRNMPLPPDVMGVKEMFDIEKMADLKKATVLLTGLSKEGDDLVEDDLEIVREGLCLRPISNSGLPVITKLVPSQLGSSTEMVSGGGVFIAAGHGPWGISHSLGTGLVMSELIQSKKPSANIDGLGLRS